MTWLDKFVIILGAISMSLIFWHVFTPQAWHIEGFYGFPLYLCCLIVGVAIGTPIIKD